LGTIALSVSAMSLFITGPFINVLAWQDGAHWLGAYGVIFAVSLMATALAVVLTASLFQAIGPKRTRAVAQVAAALIGGLFVVGLQVAAMFSTGTMSRLAFLQSEPVLAYAPRLESAFWWPAHAALGEVPAMIAVVIVSLVVFAAATAIYAPRFANFAILALGTSHGGIAHRRSTKAFRVETASAALRRKERLLLIRDPWLISQSLMQLLYLLPPALLLWHSYGADSGVAMILVPVFAMAAGQLAGGLAWLTICGEDASDLVLTAPIPERAVLRAKIEAVTQCITIVFCPFVVALLFSSLNLAFIATGVIAASAASATAIQFWFRSQAKRSHFRRRHTSSRVATFAEAFSSIAWAGTGAIAVSGSWLALVPAVIAIVILAAARSLSPTRVRAKQLLARLSVGPDCMARDWR
jgi:ABC-2 type transport system permease protein